MKFNIIFGLLIAASSHNLSAQTQQVTDEQIKRYVIAMDSIHVLKEKLLATNDKLSKGNSKVSAARYNELLHIYNDATKLADAKATPAEIEYVKKAVAIREAEMATFLKTFESLIIDYVGESVFPKVRNAIETDTVVRKKFNSFMAARTDH